MLIANLLLNMTVIILVKGFPVYRTCSAVNLKGIWPRRASTARAVHAAGVGVGFFFFGGGGI